MRVIIVGVECHIVPTFAAGGSLEACNDMRGPVALQFFVAPDFQPHCFREQAGRWKHVMKCGEQPPHPIVCKVPWSLVRSFGRPAGGMGASLCPYPAPGHSDGRA